MGSRPTTRTTDAGLRLEFLRGPRRRNGLTEWYVRAREQGSKRRTVWSGWATEQAAAVLADAAWVSRPAGAVLTVGEIFDRYLVVRTSDHKRGAGHPDYIGSKTLDSYRRCLKRVGEVLGEVPAMDLVEDDLNECVARLRAAGFSDRTVDQSLLTWRIAWRWALKQKHRVADLPMPKVKIEGYTNNHRTPHQGEVEAVLAVLSGMERDAIELLVATGARVSEVADLVCEDVFAGTGSLILRGKTGPRRLDPPAELMARICGHLHDDASDRRVFRFRDARSGTGVVKFGKQRITSALKGACIAAGVEPFTPHGLRRAMVRRLLKSQVDIGTAAHILGHSPKVMLQVYNDVTEEDRKAALAKVAVDVPIPGAESNVIRGPWGKAKS